MLFAVIPFSGHIDDGGAFNFLVLLALVALPLLALLRYSLGGLPLGAQAPRRKRGLRTKYKPPTSHLVKRSETEDEYIGPSPIPADPREPVGEKTDKADQS